jgi:hypothetical protein
MAKGGRGQDFNNQIRCSLAAMLIQLAPVTYYGDVRLNHSVNVLWSVPILLKQPNAERGRVDLAFFTLKIICKLAE